MLWYNVMLHNYYLHLITFTWNHYSLFYIVVGTARTVSYRNIPSTSNKP